LASLISASESPSSSAVDDKDRRIAELEAENARLRRIRDALITRVESSTSHKPQPYAAFEHSVILAEQVRERTEALNAAMNELKASNKALSRARNEAETTRQRLSDAIESIADGFVLFDHSHRMIQANSHFRGFWREGSGQDIMPGTCIADIRSAAVASGLIVEEHNEPGAEDSVFLLSNGRWVQKTERPTREGGLVVLYSDITDVKNTETARREEALAEKTRLLQATVDNLSQGVVLVGPEGYPEIWNHRFLSLVGLAAEQINAERPFSDLTALSEVPLLTKAAPTGAQAQDEVRRLRDGAVIEIKTHPMPDGGFVNTYTDITESYRYAETLKESERWIRVVTDHVPALIAYVGADMTVQFCNKVYENWYGAGDGSTLLGRALSEIHSPELHERLMPLIEKVLAGQSVTFEFEESNRRGEQRYMLRSYVPNLDPGGEVVGFFVMIRDITARRRTALALQQAYDGLEQRVKERTSALTDLNSQLRQEIDERAAVESRLRDAKLEADRANLSKTKFLAAVSHDLLQPLNAARLFTSSLLEHSFGSRAESLVRSVSTSLDDVENLLGTLVDISKLDAGVIKPDVTAFDLRDLLNNIAREFREMASAAGLELYFVPSSAVVLSDSQLLARILRNFLTNAIRYTGKGRILFGCRRRGETVVIQVWDTGPGIPSDKLTEIFQEFKRIRPAGAQPDKGLGLGLAIVDKIARMMGHPVTVDSVEGKGSVFSVEVPQGRLLPRKSGVESAITAHTDGGLHGARVWVVDNDRAICSGMEILLHGWGCEVITAVSLEDLASKVDFAVTESDVVLVDYHLDDDRNGVDLVAEINRLRENPLPVLMITANYSNELKKHIRDQGYLLMNKPVKPLKLRSALSHLLQGLSR
jgi:PAS domain S-box-containing protein